MVAAAEPSPSSPATASRALGVPGSARMRRSGCAVTRPPEAGPPASGAARPWRRSGRRTGSARRHQHRSTGEPRFDRRGEPGHGRGVERRGGLVQQEDGSRAEKGAGEGDPLALSGAQRQAVVPEDGSEPVRQGGDELVQPHRREHVAELVVGCTRRSEAQVVGQSGVEQVGALRQVGEP